MDDLRDALLKTATDTLVALERPLNALTVENVNLKERLGIATDLLKRLEWSGESDECPICGRWKDGFAMYNSPPGHAPDCELGTFLEAVQQEEQGNA